MSEQEKQGEAWPESSPGSIDSSNRSGMIPEKEIADQVRKRTEELLGQDEDEPLDEKFIKECLDANERGDGVLFATINRRIFLYNTTPKDGEWLV